MANAIPISAKKGAVPQQNNSKMSGKINNYRTAKLECSQRGWRCDVDEVVRMQGEGGKDPPLEVHKLLGGRLYNVKLYSVCYCRAIPLYVFTGCVIAALHI